MSTTVASLKCLLEKEETQLRSEHLLGILELAKLVLELRANMGAKMIVES